MRKFPLLAALAIALGLDSGAPPCPAAAPTVSPWVATFYSHHHVYPDLPYKQVGGKVLTLDLYLPTDVKGPVPTVLYLHGGGWSEGTRNGDMGYMLPWMELKWALVTPGYRLTGEALAPAAVEDSVSAYRWIARHAATYHFDLQRLVVSGGSAGGNLALLVGMAPASAGFDLESGAGPLPPPAAIVNISGVTDVTAYLVGPHASKFAVAWVGGPDHLDLARRVSPLSYIRPGLPPVLTVHCVGDPSVSYDQAVRLQAALDKAGVPHELLTIPGKKHGYWRPEDYIQIYATLEAFLARHRLTEAP